MFLRHDDSCFFVGERGGGGKWGLKSVSEAKVFQNNIGKILKIKKRYIWPRLAAFEEGGCLSGSYFYAIRDIPKVYDEHLRDDLLQGQAIDRISRS